LFLLFEEGDALFVMGESLGEGGGTCC
jgi:hypothetical protein